MSLGLPVVVTAVGGMDDMVDDGITGLVVPPGNVAFDRIEAEYLHLGGQHR